MAFAASRNLLIPIRRFPRLRTDAEPAVLARAIQAVSTARAGVRRPPGARRHCGRHVERSRIRGVDLDRGKPAVATPIEIAEIHRHSEGSRRRPVRPTDGEGSRQSTRRLPRLQSLSWRSSPPRAPSRSSELASDAVDNRLGGARRNRHMARFATSAAATTRRYAGASGDDRSMRNYCSVWPGAFCAGRAPSPGSDFSVDSMSVQSSNSASTKAARRHAPRSCESHRGAERDPRSRRENLALSRASAGRPIIGDTHHAFGSKNGVAFSVAPLLCSACGRKSILGLLDDISGFGTLDRRATRRFANPSPTI